MCVVERAIDAERKDVVCAGAGHLTLLERRGAAVGIKDENGGAGFAEQAVDGRRAGVAGGGAEDVDRLVADLALVLVQVAQQLEGEILECERRPVEELQHVGALVELDEWCDVRVGELGVRLGDDGAQRFLRDVRREVFEELEAELRVVQFFETGELPAEVGQRLGQVEAAVGREAGGDGVGEAEYWGLAAGGEETHGEKRHGRLGPCRFS